MNKTRVAVLISGNGSNLQALINAAKSPTYPAAISLVISNNPDAYGIKRAENERIKATVISHKNYKTREEFDRAVDANLQENNINVICLAGFMRLLSPWFVNKWHGRIINIHPSLLPDFKGANAVADALASGKSKTGCTVHYVSEEMDAGEILGQSEVEISPHDTIESLKQKIHECEHVLYPQILEKISKTLCSTVN